MLVEESKTYKGIHMDSKTEESKEPPMVVREEKIQSVCYYESSSALDLTFADLSPLNIDHSPIEIEQRKAKRVRRQMS